MASLGGINVKQLQALSPSLEGVRFKDPVMSEKNWGHNGAQGWPYIFLQCFV